MNQRYEAKNSTAGYRYTVLKEMRRMLTPLRIGIYLLCCAYPFVYLSIVQDDYSIRDGLELFTFLLDGLPAMVFAITAVAVCSGAFAEGLNHRFLIYERIRQPLGRLLRVKLTAHMLLTFIAFLLPMLLYFVVAYFLIPHYGWIKLAPYGMVLPQGMTLEQEQMERYTMTQLLEYGPWVYGIAYACWVSLNAAVYSALAFVLLLILNRSFIALALPFLLYTVGSFLVPDRRFYFFYSVFPFGSVQQPIWVLMVPFAFLLLLCTVGLLYVRTFSGRMSRLL
ncbi:hypothetical protein B9G55_02265 [Saccharibacillus sp. O16]|nr:hypothetical protein B9G55_02265 [Saccharibacillus sp. O16]